jgi:hypothetical protein
MTVQLGSLVNSVTTGCNRTLTQPGSLIGKLRAVLGSGKHLPEAEWAGRVGSPEETDARLIASLEHISGQRITLAYSTRMRDGAPTERSWDRIRWPFPAEKSDELATVIESAFRAAPSDRLAAALYKLRMTTRGRPENADEDREAQATIIIHELRKYPGDVAMHVLETWPARPNGQFWPTWHELDEVLRLESQKRRTIAACLLKYANGPRPETDAPVITKAERERVAAGFERLKQELAELKVAETRRPNRPPPGLDAEGERGWYEQHLEALKAQPKHEYKLSPAAKATNAGRDWGAPDITYGPAPKREEAA